MVATATFDFPVTSEALLVVARGSISDGQIRINPDDTGSDPNNAKVQVSIRYYHEDTLSNAKLCRIRRQNGEVGLAILVRLVESLIRGTLILTFSHIRHRNGGLIEDKTTISM